MVLAETNLLREVSRLAIRDELSAMRLRGRLVVVPVVMQLRPTRQLLTRREPDQRLCSLHEKSHAGDRGPPVAAGSDHNPPRPPRASGAGKVFRCHAFAMPIVKWGWFAGSRAAGLNGSMPNLTVVYRSLVAFLALANAAGVAFAASPDAAQIEFFEKKIRPVLVEHCYECHSAEAVKAGTLEGKLALDSRAGIRQGGESGPAVIPGDVAASRSSARSSTRGSKCPPAKNSRTTRSPTSSPG